MSDCEECKLEHFKMEKIPDCIKKSINKVCNDIQKCESLDDAHRLLIEDDVILYITIYFSLCWFVLQALKN